MIQLFNKFITKLEEEVFPKGIMWKRILGYSLVKSRNRKIKEIEKIKILNLNKLCRIYVKYLSTLFFVLMVMGCEDTTNITNRLTKFKVNRAKKFNGIEIPKVL